MLTRRSSDASVVSTVQGEGKSIASNPAKLLLSIEKLTSLIEENDFKYRENNVILMDLFDKQLKEAEEKIYAKIEQMKVDTIEKIGMAREFELDNSVYKKSNVPAIKESMKEHEDNDLNELTAKKDTELVTITPKPGFVIKTHRIEDYDKAFINVFHHAAVGIKPPKSDPHQSNANPYIVIGGVGNILDKDGHNCILYSVVVSSYYFDPSTRTRQELTGITENATITRVSCHD